MFDELDIVALTHDIKEYSLTSGDIGTIVHIYTGAKAFEVEFIAASGDTIAVLTLETKDLRSMAHNEIFHARGYITS